MMKMHKIILAAALFTFAMPLYAQAQVVSGKGIDTGADAVSAAVPQARNLGTLVTTVTDVTTQMSACAVNGQFYDSETQTCMGLDPIDMQFSQNATSTTLHMQRPDGSYVTYDLDGEDGAVNVVPFGN